MHQDKFFLHKELSCSVMAYCEKLKIFVCFVKYYIQLSQLEVNLSIPAAKNYIHNSLVTQYSSQAISRPAPPHPIHPPSASAPHHPPSPTVTLCLFTDFSSCLQIHSNASHCFWFHKRYHNIHMSSNKLSKSKLDNSRHVTKLVILRQTCVYVSFQQNNPLWVQAYCPPS